MIHNFEKNIFKTSKKLKAGKIAGLFSLHFNSLVIKHAYRGCLTNE